MRRVEQAAFAGRFRPGEKAQIEGLLACVGVYVGTWIGPETRWLVTGTAPGAGKLAAAAEHGVAVVAATWLASMRRAPLAAIRDCLASQGGERGASLLLALCPPSSRAVAADYVAGHIGTDVVRDVRSFWEPAEGCAEIAGLLMALRQAALRGRLWRSPALTLLRRVPLEQTELVLDVLRRDLCGRAAVERAPWWILSSEDLEGQLREIGLETRWLPLVEQVSFHCDALSALPPSVAGPLRCAQVVGLTGVAWAGLATRSAESLAVRGLLDGLEGLRTSVPGLDTVSVSVPGDRAAWRGLATLVAALPATWTGLIVQCGSTVPFDACELLARALAPRAVGRLELRFDAEPVGLAPIFEAVHDQRLTHVEFGSYDRYVPTGVRRAAWWESVQRLVIRAPAPESGGMLTMYLRNARGPRLRHLGAEMQTHAGDLLAIGEEAFPHLTSLDASMYAASNDLAARDNRFARFVAGQSFRQLRQLRLGALREDEVSTLGAVDTALDRLEVRRANLGPLLRAGALSPLVRWQLRTEGLSRN